MGIEIEDALLAKARRAAGVLRAHSVLRNRELSTPTSIVTDPIAEAHADLAELVLFLIMKDRPWP